MASNILIADPPENGDIGVELIFVAESIAIQEKIIPLGMLQIDKSKFCACGHRGVVARINIQGVAQNRELQAGGYQE
ncbi:hypothetical protein D3C85_1519330 [compost metagenome]